MAKYGGAKVQGIGENGVLKYHSQITWGKTSQSQKKCRKIEKYKIEDSPPPDPLTCALF